MASSKWKSVDEIRDSINGRPVVYWGASHWVGKTQQALNIHGEVIVDNNPNNLDVSLFDLRILNPLSLLQAGSDKYYVIITTGNFTSVIDELHALGFVMGDDFCCTPLLAPRQKTDALRKLDRTLLLSSPQHSTSATTGGGLYRLDLMSKSVEKVYSGKCRGLSRAEFGYVTVDMLRGVVLLDHEFREISLIEVEKNSEPHGLFHRSGSNEVAVGQPGRDSIGFYDIKTGRLESELFVSDKWARNQCDNHHVNDLLIVDDSLFVSMFSFSGNWMNEVYDGGVMEFDLKSGKLVGPVISNLWKPHSVSRFGGKLTVLDSMRGTLVSQSWRTMGGFSSFARGLDFDGQYFYVGLSEHRHPNSLVDSNAIIGLDTGVAVFDPESKLSRFIAMEQIENVHSVLCL